MTRITTTVETVSITDIKEGDTLLDGDGERIVVKTITSCSPHRLRYQDAEGENRCVLLDCVLRVVPEEPTEEETEDEDDCDGSCLACIIMRLLTAAAAGKGKEGEE